MHAGSEARQFRRYPIQLPLRHTPKTSTAAGSDAGWTRNLSEKGACLELAERLPVEMPLRLRIRTDRGAIEAEAVVVWSGGSHLADGGILHGVAFTDPAPHQLQTLRDLLISRGPFRPAGVRLPFDVAVTCQFTGQERPPLRGGTRDISRGGLLLRLPQLLPPATPVDLTLHTPAGPVTAQGSVVWVAPPEQRTLNEPVRHGLRFTVLGWAKSLGLASIVAESPERLEPLSKDVT